MVLSASMLMTSFRTFPSSLVSGDTLHQGASYIGRLLFDDLDFCRQVAKLLRGVTVFRYFPPAVAKVYIVSFRIHDERRTKSRKFLLCELPTELSAYGIL